MKRRLLFLATVLSLCGCATFKEVESGLFHHPAMGWKLDEALKELEAGKESAAAASLEALTKEPGADDITDEALFRLALLRLREGNEAQAPQLLERLKKEYPKSAWTRQAEPLFDFLKSIEEMKVQLRDLKILNMSLTRENKDMQSQKTELQNLKNTNQSLARENKELRQSIERLKSLDIELEKKSR